MAATYNPASGSLRDLARLRLADRGPTFILQDEEIDAMLSCGLTTNEAFAQLAETVASFYSQQLASSKVGSVERSYFATRILNYQQLATQIRTGPPIGGAMVQAAVGQMVQPDLSEYRP